MWIWLAEDGKELSSDPQLWTLTSGASPVSPHRKPKGSYTVYYDLSDPFIEQHLSIWSKESDEKILKSTVLTYSPLFDGIQHNFVSSDYPILSEILLIKGSYHIASFQLTRSKRPAIYLVS